MKNHRGMAIILVISAFSLLALMMVEFTFGTQINLQISKNFQNAVKAKALSRSGVYFALLELKVYKELKPLAQKINLDPSMLNMIWQFGFMYPPLPSAKGTFGTEKAIQELTKVSKIDGNISVTISDESSKINLNELANKNPKIKEAIQTQLLRIFEDKLQSDEAFSDQYRDTRFREYILNIQDWIDEDRERSIGGDEESYYGRLRTPYKPKNAPLDTVSELALIEGFDDETLFNLLASAVTVYPTQGININSADAIVLKSISHEMTAELVGKILEHRQKMGGFKTAAEFLTFCNFTQKPEIPLTTETSIFLVESTAEVHGASQTTQVIVDTTKELPNGMPNIVYWNMN